MSGVMKGVIKRHFECACHSDEHTLVITLDEDDDGPEIYTSVFLTDWPCFWKRAYEAVRYVFGHKSKFGHFDTFTFRPRDVREMMKLMDRYVEIRFAETEDPVRFQKFWDGED